MSLGLSFVQVPLWVWKRRCGIRLRAKQAGIVYVDCLHVSWWMSNTTLQRGSPAHGLSAPRKLWDGVLGHDVTLGTWQSAPTRLYKVTLTKWYRWYFEMTAFNFLLRMVFFLYFFNVLTYYFCFFIKVFCQVLFKGEMCKTCDSRFAYSSPAPSTLCLATCLDKQVFLSKTRTTDWASCQNVEAPQCLYLKFSLMGKENVF